MGFDNTDLESLNLKLLEAAWGSTITVGCFVLTIAILTLLASPLWFFSNSNLHHGAPPDNTPLPPAKKVSHLPVKQLKHKIPKEEVDLRSLHLKQTWKSDGRELKVEASV